MRKHKPGNGRLQVGAAVALFTITLGFLGPAIDAEPYGGSNPPLQDVRASEADQERQALDTCLQEAGEGARWSRTERRGEIACTDGQRNIITIYHRSDRRAPSPRPSPRSTRCSGRSSS